MSELCMVSFQQKETIHYWLPKLRGLSLRLGILEHKKDLERNISGGKACKCPLKRAAPE